jgi:hypothetical protein
LWFSNCQQLFFQVCFDSEGFYTFGKTRTKTGQKFVRDQTVALLVNLEEGSPNQNTVLRRNVWKM